MSETRKPLRLVAQDVEDLKLISAAVQDSVSQISDIQFDSKGRRFLIALNRYRWEADTGKASDRQRARSVLSFDGVLGARTRGLPREPADTIISLLSIQYEPDEIPPGGRVVLVFAGAGEIALDVECLDVVLADLGPSWRTRRKPNHERERN